MMGLKFALDMKKRTAQLRELQRIVSYFEGEITYRHAILSEACLLVAAKCGQPFREWLENLGNELALEDDERKPESFYESWCASLDFLKKNTKLKAGDIAVLKSLGQAFGYLDIQTQQMTVELEKENLSKIIKYADEELVSHMRISVVFGVLGGLMIVIMLV